MLRVYGIETPRRKFQQLASAHRCNIRHAAGSNHCWLKHSQRTVYAPLRSMRTGGLRVIRARFTCSGAQGS
jgi:hypothetical protein